MGAVGGASTVVFILDGQIEMPVCVLADPGNPDLDLVNSLARCSLAMRRRGWEVRVRNPHHALCELIELVGLAGVLGLEPRRQAERREQPGVEEVVQRDELAP